MKTIYIKVDNPFNVGLEDKDINFNNVKKWCIKVYVCRNESFAFEVYANTNTCGGWSTLLNDDANIDEFVDKVAKALVEHNTEWLETYCV